MSDSSTAEGLVAFIVSQPGMADRLRATHVDDGTGRCASCSGGAQTGRYRYRCALRIAADEAHRLLTEAGRP